MSRPLFSLPIRVYWEDTDAGGVVYHARYLQFLERARSDWLRELGVVQSELREREGLVFAVHSMQLEFRAPARLDDLLEARVDALRAGRASLEFRQSVCGGPEGQPRVQAKVKVACLQASSFRPAPMSQSLLDLFSQVQLFFAISE